MRHPLPTQERLRALFVYQDGKLFWKVSPNSRAPAGSEAGCVGTFGYRQVRVDKICYKTHRLIWKLHKGTDPGPHLDHINGDPTDNRIENLQQITNRENTHKGLIHSRKRSGLPLGVYRQAKGKPYYSMIYRDGKNHRLGNYGTIEEAAAAYNDALRKATRVDCRDN